MVRKLLHNESKERNIEYAIADSGVRYLGKVHGRRLYQIGKLVLTRPEAYKARMRAATLRVA